MSGGKRARHGRRDPRTQSPPIRRFQHATKSSLKLSKADKGKKISCRITAHLAGFANGVATTASVKVTS